MADAQAMPYSGHATSELAPPSAVGCPLPNQPQHFLLARCQHREQALRIGGTSRSSTIGSPRPTAHSAANTALPSWHLPGPSPVVSVIGRFGEKKCPSIRGVCFPLPIGGLLVLVVLATPLHRPIDTERWEK
jgi:hypothetical protein